MKVTIIKQHRPKSLSDLDIEDIFKDNSGDVWIVGVMTNGERCFFRAKDCRVVVAMQHDPQIHHFPYPNGVAEILGNINLINMRL